MFREHCPKAPQEVEKMRQILYASTMDDLMHAKDFILIGYTDFDFHTNMVSRKFTFNIDS